MKDLLDIFIHKIKQPLNNLNLIIYSIKQEVDHVDVSDLNLSEQMVHSMNYMIESFRPFLKVYGNKVPSDRISKFVSGIPDNLEIDEVWVPVLERLAQDLHDFSFDYDEGRIVLTGKGAAKALWDEYELETVATVVTDYLGEKIEFSESQIIITGLGEAI